MNKFPFIIITSLYLILYTLVTIIDIKTRVRQHCFIFNTTLCFLTVVKAEFLKLSTSDIFEPDGSVMGSCPCIVRCLAACLASTYYIAPPLVAIIKTVSRLAKCLLRGKIMMLQNNHSRQYNRKVKRKEGVSILQKNLLM